MVARAVPKYTPQAFNKPEPVMVTVVPPAAGPRAGVMPPTETPLTVGGAT